MKLDPILNRIKQFWKFNHQLHISKKIKQSCIFTLSNINSLHISLNGQSPKLMNLSRVSNPPKNRVH